MKDFRDLQVWHKAHALTLAIYKATKSFPREELYGLTSQLRRSAASIGSNLAEGCGRGSDPELARFAQIAAASAAEVEYQLPLAHDLGLIAAKVYSELDVAVVEVKRMLTGLLRKLRADR